MSRYITPFPLPTGTSQHNSIANQSSPFLVRRSATNNTIISFCSSLSSVLFSPRMNDFLYGIQLPRAPTLVLALSTSSVVGATMRPADMLIQPSPSSQRVPQAPTPSLIILELPEARKLLNVTSASDFPRHFASRYNPMCRRTLETTGSGRACWYNSPSTR